jgi:hypothetical protein
LVTGHGDPVHVLGGGLGPLQVVLLVRGPVHRHVLAPTEDVLHADGDEPPVLAGHQGALTLAAASAQVRDPRVRVAVLLGLGMPGEGRPDGQGRVRVQPQGDW